MSVERFFEVCIKVTVENDGWSYMRSGPERSTEVLSLKEALGTYSSEEILKAIDAARKIVEDGRKTKK